MELSALIAALWVAASVFVVWWGLAQAYLRRRAAVQSAEPEEDAALAMLEAQSQGLDSAWETVQQFVSPNRS